MKKVKMKFDKDELFTIYGLVQAGMQQPINNTEYYRRLVLCVLQQLNHRIGSAIVNEGIKIHNFSFNIPESLALQIYFTSFEIEFRDEIESTYVSFVVNSLLTNINKFILN